MKTGPDSADGWHAEEVVVERLRAAGCVFAEEEARLLVAEAQTPVALAAMVDARVAGHPLEQVVGFAEFCGLRIALDPGVFVPRRRTQVLAEQAAALAGAVEHRPVVVDLCCGSGAVGAALAAAVGPVELYAVEIDPAAVRCARRNLAGIGAEVFEGDLYAPLPTAVRGRVDVLVANVPYVPTDAISMMPPEAREHEPRVALDGGVDGLHVFRRVVSEAPRWLRQGGSVLVETSARQAGPAVEALTARGLVPRVVNDDDLGATVVVGRLARAVSWPARGFGV
jgi:release factor glutamine methyltransferase